ncbi:MAG TPA: hypothetical protein VL527_06720 [Dongiaceae bacterium]|jgi:hypothetical protein|nr:hypothetical protein [Dongiaceae bacterium]
MIKVKQLAVLAGLAAALCVGSSSALAQQDNGGGPGGGGPGRGNFDPAQFQQRMMERYKEVLEVNSDDEWTALQPLVQKVMEARRDAMAGGFGGMRGMFGRGNRGGNNNGDATANNRPRGGMFGTPMPEQEALQKAIDAKASASELKDALAKFEAARKAKQADLEKAQADLRKVLTVRQEAIATLNGLL